MDDNDRENKLDVLRDNFILVCKQYNQLGVYLRIEAEASAKGNLPAAIDARQKFMLQFNEAGEQLKTLGAIITEIYENGGGGVADTHVAGRD